jgi:hypothetical protein
MSRVSLWHDAVYSKNIVVIASPSSTTSGLSIRFLTRFPVRCLPQKLFSLAHSSLPASSQSEKNPIGNLADHEDVGKYKPELASVGAPVPADPYLDYV